MALFVSCGPGLEELLSEELAELGIGDTYKGFCGVYVRGCPSKTLMETIYTINYCSRIAARVLLPLQQFRCYDEKSLYRGADQIEWKHFFRRGQTFAIDANVNHPRLRNSHFCAQLMKDAICDQLRKVTGTRPSVDVKNPDIQLNLFIHKDEGIISFDTSGAPLHKRGYRQDAGEAPLQESVAAALLRLAGYQGNEIMIDPCCGSGTLLIEAALIASKTPPGFLRKQWGFFHHPDFNHDDWLKVKNEADSHKMALPAKSFIGCEIDSNVARLCRANLRAAGGLEAVEIYRTDFAEFEPSSPPNFLMTNPPHGKRLMSDDSGLRALYRKLGDFMKRKMAKPSRGFVFTGNLALTKEVGLAAKRRHVVNNSGVDSRLLEFDLF